VLAAVQMLENKMWGAAKRGPVLEPYVEVADFAAVLIERFVLGRLVGRCEACIPSSA
jgi:hypothetical protein